MRPDLAAVRRESQWAVPQDLVDALADGNQAFFALLDEFHRLADRHERGVLVEQVMKLLVTS